MFETNTLVYEKSSPKIPCKVKNNKWPSFVGRNVTEMKRPCQLDKWKEYISWQQCSETDFSCSKCTLWCKYSYYLRCIYSPGSVSPHPLLPPTCEVAEELIVSSVWQISMQWSWSDWTMFLLQGVIRIPWPLVVLVVVLSSAFHWLLPTTLLYTLHRAALELVP